MKKIFLGLFSVVLLLLLFHQYYVPVRSIECLTQFGPCPEGMSEQWKGLVGKRIGVVATEVRKSVANNENITEVSHTYRFPAKVLFYMELKKGEVAVQINEQEKLVILDSDGVKMGLAEQSQLPTLEVTTYEPDWDEIAHSAQLLSSIYYWNGLKRASMDNNKLSVEQTDIFFYFPLDGDLDYQLGAYKLLLSWLNTEQGEIKINNRDGRKIVLDLRYNNPVIRYE